MAADVESPWDDLLSDIRTEQLNLKQCLGACWDEAIVFLGLSSPKSLLSCSLPHIYCPHRIRVACFERSSR